MTSLTATHLRLADRGEIRIGAWADLVVFDPERVSDTATYDDPHRYPEGIEHVVVNGALALEAGETAPGRSGRFLRHGRDLGGA
jgi:N-acyl-D-amino-acid deacylase